MGAGTDMEFQSLKDDDGDNDDVFSETLSSLVLLVQAESFFHLGQLV